MNYLLDTCAILHIAQNPKALSEEARALIAHLDNPIAVSAISVGELACLHERGRIRLSSHWKSWFRTFVAQNNWEILPITQEIMEEAYSLPEPIHRDPSDRLLIATARIHRMPLVTTDPLILSYPHVETLT